MPTPSIPDLRDRMVYISTLLSTATPDDFGNDADHAAPFPVGGVISGAIDYADDQDWFKLNLQELTVYTVTMKAAKTGDGTLPWLGYRSAAELALWDPQANGGEGRYIFPEQESSKDADLVVTIPVMQSGDYYLRMAAAATRQVGTYKLNLAVAAHDDYFGDEARAAPIAAGGMINGRFDYTGDTDTFKAYLTAGVTYTFDLLPGAGVTNLSALELNMSNAIHSAWARAYRSDGHLVLSFSATTTGDYYISAVNTGTTLGPYQITMGQAPDDFGSSPERAGTLAIGTSVQGKLEVSGDHDWFAVQLKAGTTYTFQLDGGYEGPFSTLALRTAAGDERGYAFATNNGCLLTWKADLGGTYYLDVGNQIANNNLPYTLQARLADTDDYGNTPATAGLIAVGQPASGRLETPGDVDWFKVSMKANTAYTFQLHPVNEGSNTAGYSTSQISIVDANGQVLADMWNGGAKDQVSWQATADGNYFVAVSSYNEIFSYTVSSSANDQDRYPGNATTTATLSPGQLIHSAIDFSGDTDWFRVELQAGQQYTFQMSGANQGGGTLRAPQMVLYDSTLRPLWTANTEVVNDPYRIYTPTVSGTYFLQAGGTKQPWDDSNTGTYTLKEGSGTVPIVAMPPQALDLYGPTMAGSSPATDHLYVHFDQGVNLGTGTVSLRLASGQLIEKFDVATSNRVWIGTANNLVIDPSAPLAYGTSYRIDVDATAVRNLSGQGLAVPYSGTLVTIEQGLNVVGGAGNDVFYNTGNSDRIDGGPGLDTVIYKDSYTRHMLQIDGEAITVASADSDLLVNVERVIFDDRAFAFDVDGIAGQSYRLYRASFSRTPDEAGLGYWIAQMDKGMSLHDVARQFIASAEFKALFGAAPSDAAFVTALYGNVLHRAPDQAGADYWSTALAQGMERTDVLVQFSTSAENQAAVAELIAQGIAYLPYH